MKVFKNNKQRFLAVFLSLVFVMMLVPFTDVYASSKLVPATGGKYSFSGNEYPVYLIKITSSVDEWWELVSLGSFSVSIYDSDFYECNGVTDATDLNGNKHPSSVYYWRTYDPPLENMPSYYCLGVGNNTSMIYTYIYEFLTNGDTSEFDCTYADSETTLEDSNFDVDVVGKLKIKDVVVKASNNGRRVDINYGAKTTTGLKIGTDVVVKGFIQVEYTDSKGNVVFSSPLEFCGESSTTTYEYKYIEDYQKMITEKYPKTEYGNFVGGTYCYTYIVPYSSSLKKYGGMSKVYFDKDSKKCVVEDVSNITDGVPDTDEDSKSEIDEYTGNGETDEDADESAQDNIDDGNKVVVSDGSDIITSVEDAISIANSMLRFIGNIPTIISTVFSFLPPWCLNVVGVFFVALLAIIMYKALRG